MNKLLLIMVVCSVVFAGCVEKRRTEAGSTASDSRDLISYEDKARGVVCYRVSGRDGLSCIKAN